MELVTEPDTAAAGEAKVTGDDEEALTKSRSGSFLLATTTIPAGGAAQVDTPPVCSFIEAKAASEGNLSHDAPETRPR
jgi:hypothetical protein